MESHAVEYEILPGLPPYGPPAIPFSATGMGTHSEGFVVRFFTSTGDTWVGNFIGPLDGCNAVVRHPDGRHWVVIAKGQAYVVNPETRECIQHFGGDIQEDFDIAAPRCIVLATLTDFIGLNAAGQIWRSDRVSWDGLRNLTVNGGRFSGEAYSPLSNSWHEFELDATTGRVRGGSYRPPAQAHIWREPVIR